MVLDNTVLAFIFGFIAGTVGLALAYNLKRQLTPGQILITGLVVVFLYAGVYAIPGLSSGMNPLALWTASACGVGIVTLIALLLRHASRTTGRPIQYGGKGEHNGL
jgi:ascorbate-specific PTS system EIIC-type component UlaA